MRIAIVYSNRAEYGLVLPVIEKLKRIDDIEFIDIELNPSKELFDISKLVDYTDKIYNLLNENKPDLVITPFDRIEVGLASVICNSMNIKTVQIHAGDLSQGTWDDRLRHSITMLSDIHFCNGEKSFNRVKQLLETVVRPTDQVYEVGTTAFDDITFDHSLVPDKDYFIVLYHPPTSRLDLLEKEIQEIEQIYKDNPDKHFLFLNPNNDPGSETIINKWKELAKNDNVTFYKEGVERSKYLGLIDRCTIFVGNSSSMFYEIYNIIGKEKIIHIGLRNKGREYVKARKGASDRIVKILTGV